MHVERDAFIALFWDLEINFIITKNVINSQFFVVNSIGLSSSNRLNIILYEFLPPFFELIQIVISLYLIALCRQCVGVRGLTVSSFLLPLIFFYKPKFVEFPLSTLKVVLFHETNSTQVSPKSGASKALL